MYLFEENEYVIYKGDGSTFYEPRRNSSLAIIDKMDEDKFPFVGLKMIPSGELVGVEARLIRKIQTNEKRLLKIGFEKSVINKAEYYKLGGLTIGGVVLFPAPGYVYFAGLENYLQFPFEVDTNQFIKNGEVEVDALEQFFPDMHNLNQLVKYLNDNGISNMTIPEIVEIESIY